MDSARSALRMGAEKYISSTAAPKQKCPQEEKNMNTPYKKALYLTS